MAYPLTNTFEDENGHSILLSNNVLDIVTVDQAGSSFWSPTSDYSGYAADGHQYILGEEQPGEIASWSSELEGFHRGPAGAFPRQFFLILTDEEVSIVDAADFTLFLRVIAADIILEGTEVPGTFLEWAQDESVVLGSSLGILGSSFYQIGWADGRLVIATSQGLRVLDFRTDTALAYLDAGEYRAGGQSGLAYRNLQNYFGTAVYSPLGATSTQTISARKMGESSYYVFGTESDSIGDGITVYRWTPSTIIRSFKSLTAVPVDSLILPSGILILLVVWDDAGTDRLKLIRSVSDWMDPGDWSYQSSNLPVQAGSSGRLSASGDTILVSAGSGIWAIDEGDIGGNVELRYGKTLVAAEAFPPTYEILTVSDASVSDVCVDPNSGNIGILHGNYLDVVNPNKNILEETYSTSTFPALPSTPRVVHAFSLPVPEIEP